MKTFYISVTEVLNRVVQVEAETDEEATEKVRKAYENSEIVLSNDDYAADKIEDCTEEVEDLISGGYETPLTYQKIN